MPLCIFYVSFQFRYSLLNSDAVFQFYNLIVQSPHVVVNPTISFQILLFTFLFLLAYAIIIRFRILCSLFFPGLRLFSRRCPVDQ